MSVNWELLLRLLLTWKYLFFTLYALAGWLLLARRRATRGPRLVLQAAALITFGGILGLLVPWAARAFGLHPSPMCAFSKGIAIPILYGKLGHPMILLMAVVIVFTLVGGKAFCGWVCPLGALQELVGRIPGLRRFRLCFRLSNSVRVAAVILFFVLLFSAGRIAYDWFNPFELFHWSHLGALLVWGPMALVLLASLFVYRPFCSLLCPIGLLSWLFEKLSFGKIRVSDACDACGVCLEKTDCQAMPALVARRGVVPDCHGCGDCLDSCPQDAITFSWKKAD